MLGNMKIGTKLGLGFGVILALLVIYSATNFVSFDDMSGLSHKAQEQCQNQAFAVEKECDHLKWMAELSDLFLNDEISQVTVQTDDHQCGLGKWMYSEEVTQMRSSDPDLDRILKQLEEPHHRLHASAIKIDEMYVDFDDGLEVLLADRWIDHLQWVKAVANSNLNRTVFDGGLDPRECAFGKWYYSYRATDAKFGELLKRWEDPHNRLHLAAGHMVEAQKAGNWEQARQIYHDEILVALDELTGVYAETDEYVMAQAETKHAAWQVFETETREAIKEAQGHLNTLVDHFKDRSFTAVNEVNSSLDSSVNLGTVLTIVALVIGLLAAFSITRGITRPLKKVVEATKTMNQEFQNMEEVVESIASNDLTCQIKETASVNLDINSKDEVGTLVASIEDSLACKDRMSVSMQRMVANLNNMVQSLAANAHELSTATTEVASTSEQMSRGAKDQTMQVTQVSTAVEEMTATVVESSKNASDASEGARSAADTAQDGGRIVNDTIQGMQSIANTVRESAESIGKLASSADQIGEIIGVIDDIADQTNLLALNAAIEAARAGEQGRGFAVVADEVRKLAERTGKATGEITEMIQGIQGETKEAVEAMESGIQQVDSGRELADTAGNSLTQIVEFSQRVMDMIQQIATATEQQSVAAEEISKNIEHVASISRESAAGAEQSAAAAEQVNRQAEGLRGLVESFKTNQTSTGIVELAKHDHKLYVKKLEAIVRDPRRANKWDVVDHHNCRFGKWYYSEATQGIRGDSAFASVEDPHMKVHDCANRAVEAARNGDNDLARELNDKAHLTSLEVIEKLSELERHMEVGATA